MRDLTCSLTLLVLVLAHSICNGSRVTIGARVFGTCNHVEGHQRYANVVEIFLEYHLVSHRKLEFVWWDLRAYHEDNRYYLALHQILF